MGSAAVGAAGEDAVRLSKFEEEGVDLFAEADEFGGVVPEKVLLAAGGVGEQAEREGAFTALGEVLDPLGDAVFEDFDVVLCQGEY